MGLEDPGVRANVDLTGERNTERPREEKGRAGRIPGLPPRLPTLLTSLRI